MVVKWICVTDAKGSGLMDYRTLFKQLDKLIAELMRLKGLSREQACSAVAGHALARQAEAAQDAARKQ